MDGRVKITTRNQMVIELTGYELCLDDITGFIEMTPTRARVTVGVSEPIRVVGNAAAPSDERAQVLSERPEKGKPEVVQRLEAAKKTEENRGSGEETVFARWVKAEEQRTGKPVVAAEIAKRIGIHKTDFYSYRSGKRRPGAVMEHKIAAAFGVTVDEYRAGPEKTKPKEVSAEKKDNKLWALAGKTEEKPVKPLSPEKYAAAPGCTMLTETVMAAICQACKDAGENDCVSCPLKAARGLALKKSGGIVDAVIMGQLCDTCYDLDPENAAKCGKCRMWEARQAQDMVDEGRMLAGVVARVEAARRVMMEDAA